MNPESTRIQPPDLLPEPGARRLRVRRRFTAALASGHGDAAASPADSPDRPKAPRRGGGARVLRRWSVSDLIARAAAAPRAMA